MQRKPHTGILLAVAVIAALASGAGCDKLRARDNLNKGVKRTKAASSTSPSKTSSRPRNSIPP